MKKLSICTVCMGRTKHLAKTLLKNMSDNAADDVEFVVLDYNSPDGLDNFIRTHFDDEMAVGTLNYFKTHDPVYFDLSHAKNVVSKLAKGQIICLVDADNYAGPGYAQWVKNIFAKKGLNTVITTIRKDDIPFRDQGGKLCFSKKLFFKVKGFDESLTGYGMDDVDLVNRLEKAGGVRHFIEQPEFLQFIGHSNAERIKNYHLANNLHKLFVLMKDDYHDYICPALYFLKDQSFMLVNYQYRPELSDDVLTSYLGWIITDDGLKRGVYRETKENIELTFAGKKKKQLLRVKDNRWLCAIERSVASRWQHIDNTHDSYANLLLTFGECYNRKRFISNDADRIRVNQSGFGAATVFRNFDGTRPIIV